MPRTIRTSGSTAIDRELDALSKRIEAAIAAAKASQSATMASVTQVVTQIVTDMTSGPDCCAEVIEARDSSLFGLYPSLDARLEAIEAILAGGTIPGIYSYDFSLERNSMYAALGVW